MSSLNSAGQDLEAEPGDYRPISTLAVIGLLFGAASVLAFVHPLLWLLPLLGAVASGWALARLASPDSIQIGRKAALVGLTLSLVFGAAAPLRLTILHWQLRSESRYLSKQWFEALRAGDPYRAHQLTKLASQRISGDDDLAIRYAEPQLRHDIEEYLKEQAVQTLLSLGKYATVRYFGNRRLYIASTESSISDFYAVSVRDHGETTSFFVQMTWSRSFDYGSQSWSWRLTKADFERELPPSFNPAP